jgi:hypothetical protein
VLCCAYFLCLQPLALLHLRRLKAGILLSTLQLGSRVHYLFGGRFHIPVTTPKRGAGGERRQRLEGSDSGIYYLLSENATARELSSDDVNYLLRKKAEKTASEAANRERLRIWR